MFPVLAAELLVRCREQQQVRDHETHRENLHCAESVVQQDFRAHEARAPEGDRHDGKHVPEGYVVSCRSHRGQR